MATDDDRKFLQADLLVDMNDAILSNVFKARASDPEMEKLHSATGGTSSLPASATTSRQTWSAWR